VSIKAGDKGEVGVPSVNSLKYFTIYNTEGIVNIFVNDGRFENATLAVSNTLGQTLATQPLNSNLTHIDINQFGKGIYVITIQRGDEVFSKKISLQ
jgi:hypothetical protein